MRQSSALFGVQRSDGFHQTLDTIRQYRCATQRRAAAAPWASLPVDPLTHGPYLLNQPFGRFRVRVLHCLGRMPDHGSVVFSGPCARSAARACARSTE